MCSGAVSKIKTSLASIHNYSKEWFCKCRGYHSLRLKQSSNRIWLKNSSEIKGNFSHWCRFFFSKIAYYESFWGNICRGFFVWASRALVALQKLILKQGDGSSHQYCIITNQPIDVAFMRKNKNVVCMYSYICSRPFIITGLQWLQPEIRILIIF